MTLNEILKLTEAKPRFTHDCDRCEWLGQYGKHDLYVCPSVHSDPAGISNQISTLIARTSSRPGDYSSGADFGVICPEPHPLREAMLRALTLGFQANADMKGRAWDLWAAEQLKAWSQTPQL